MAKKNSTKTATKEALQYSEPKMQAFRQWKGINFSEVSPLWNSYVDEVYTEDRQTDLPPNFLLVQNNLRTTPQAAIETTFRPVKWIEGPKSTSGKDYQDGTGSIHVNKFTGINYIDHDYGYFACDTGQGDAIMALNRLGIDEHYNDKNYEITPNWMKFTSNQSTVASVANQRVTDMHVYLNRLICMVEKTETINGVEVTTGGIYATVSDNEHNFPVHTLLPGYELEPQTRPEDAPIIETFGKVVNVDPDNPQTDPDTGQPYAWSVQCGFYYCLTNQWGSTQPSTYIGDNKQNPSQPHTGEGVTKAYFNLAPIQWTNADYIRLSGEITQANMDKAYIGGSSWQPVSVDIYMVINENTYPIYVGHADAQQESVDGVLKWMWHYDYYGSMTDLSEWNNANLIVPEDNTTGGVPCRYCTQIDGKLYFWGDPAHPYRFYIGGNAQHELSVALGHGGAYCDIEPGSGCEVKLIEKFKTYGGSSIVTILCSNVNGTRQHRYNLIETNIISTSELSTAAYMVEEIANVVGTTSRWGGGAWSDGLYYINRNGLMVTTQQMEYSSQLRSIIVSDPISPVFEEQKGTEIDNSRVVCCKDTIYMATVPDDDNYVGIDSNISHYNSFIWCYDIGLKVWYTIQPTITTTVGNEVKDIPLTANGLFIYDHEDSVFYGVGIVDPLLGVWISPVLSNQENSDFTFDNPQPFEFQTSELGTTQPNLQWQWLCQLEFNFDYFVGEMEIEIDGVDYYGRRMHIVKKVVSPKDIDNNKPVMLTAFRVPVRIDTLVRYYHIVIKGDGMLRLNNIAARTYTQSKKIGITYGFDAEHYYMDRFNSQKKRYMHDAVSVYNNLDKIVYDYRARVLNPGEVQSEYGATILDKETATVT